MLNREKLSQILALYKQNFHKHWKDECYKWEAVKHFQENWDIHAEDFGRMFQEATAKTYNLLASMNNFPRATIKSFALADAEETRKMFLSLFDESVNVGTRIERFEADSEKMRAKYDDGSWKQHYQGANAITTYLWLRYPEKYFIYKYSEVHAAAKALESGFVPKRGSSIANVTAAFALYEEIASVLKEDRELMKMLEDAYTKKTDPDPAGHTLAIDFGFYIHRYYEYDVRKNNPENVPERDYWPTLEEYNPGLTKDDWKRFILEIEKPYHPSPMQMLKAMMELGGEASCKKLSEIYGGTPSAYIGDAVNLGKRARKYFDLEVMKEGDRERYYVIPFFGRDVYENGKPIYNYKMRPELYEALSEIDLTDVSPYYPKTDDEASAFEAMEETPDIQRECDEYAREDFLREVYMSAERFDTLTALLKNKKNLILQGAPGVGKTFAAKRLAYAMMGEKDESRIEFIQFHQNYSYEDFVMGYKPYEDGFRLTEGIFYRFCKKARQDSGRDYFFIIDEINRGNLSRIFGELLMLLERDYRKEKISLAYSSERFGIPENVYLIGMMNTADRSLALMDYALRRRFSFFEMEPAFHTDGFEAYRESLQNETFNLLIEKIRHLNREIREDDSLGAGFCIGHSYFCGQEKAEEAWMRSVVFYDILPMLQEYWFDDKKSLLKWENELSGVFDD